MSDFFDFSEKYIYLSGDTASVIKMSCCRDDTCRIDSVITMDAKGQIVLPKDLREKAGIKPNEKLAVVACEKEGEVCCIMLVKADRLADAVTKALGPLLKSVTNQENQE
jgi:antitoxin PrlF